MNDRALFLYGFDITSANKYINFQNIALGPIFSAELTIGNYTATELLAEIKRAMELIDGVYKYTWSINRGVNAGTSNQITVSTTSSYFSLLFGSGPSAASSPRDLLGFNQTDYTGSTTYTGPNQAGLVLYPDFPTYNYLAPDYFVTNDGSKNISASGIKETLVFAQMKFIQGQWRYITDFKNAGQATAWSTFLKYASRQLKFEFTPSVQENYNVFYKVTIESTTGDNNGMGFKLEQMLGAGLYRFYDTGLIKMRVIPG